MPLSETMESGASDLANISQSPTRPEVEDERSWKSNPEKSVGEGRRREAVDNEEQRRAVGSELTVQRMT